MGEKIIKLSFRGPVHFGGGRLSDAEYACDAGTIFSALFIEALGMGRADELLGAFSSGSCAISDAFPYVGKRLYLPKPMGPTRQHPEEKQISSDSRARKAGKKLKYVPADRLEDYLGGTFDAVAELERFNIGASQLRTKVNLTRETKEDADPYFVGGYSFNESCGIYFIYSGDYDLSALLDRLSFSGLGGKRTSGYGAFEYKIEDSGLRKERRGEGRRQMLLSSAAPREMELTDDLIADAKYRLERKGGFVQSASHASTPRKKRDLWVFRPGSVFDGQFEGDIFDVNDTPGGHPVYRYARAMWMEV